MVNVGPKKCRKAVKRAVKDNAVARRVLLERCRRCGMCPKLLVKQFGVPLAALMFEPRI